MDVPAQPKVTPEQNVFLQVNPPATAAPVTPEWQAVYDKIAAQNKPVDYPTPPVATPVATPPQSQPQAPIYPAGVEVQAPTLDVVKANFDKLYSQNPDAAYNYALDTTYYRELGLSAQIINSYSPGGGNYMPAGMGYKFHAASGLTFAMQNPDGTVSSYMLAVPVADNGLAIQMLYMKRGG